MLIVSPSVQTSHPAHVTNLITAFESLNVFPLFFADCFRHKNMKIADMVIHDVSIFMYDLHPFIISFDKMLGDKMADVESAVYISINCSEPYFPRMLYGLNLLRPITYKHILFVRIVSVIGCWQTLHTPEVAHLVATFKAFHVFPNLFHH